VVWIDPARVAVEGIGEDADTIRPGARIFDTTQVAQGRLWRMPTAVETCAFPGPTGRFFSDGDHLFSADTTGLHTWDPTTGLHLATMPGFSPTHHHRPSGTFVEAHGKTARAWTHR
jgi:hypothetical protein